MTELAGQVLIRAGVPGKPDLKVDHGKPYPNTTTDMAKLLAERGLTILEFASSILGDIGKLL